MPKVKKLICPVCGKEFIRETNAQVYCSEKCRRIYNRRKPMNDNLKEYTCAYCGKTFKWDRKKTYCSDECRLQANGRRQRKPRKPKCLPMHEIEELARKENLSYGQVVAKYGL